MYKMLIIEDEPTIRNGIKVWFEKSQFKVFEAEDGKKGIDMLKKQTFDIIILDVMLPYFDGYEILQFIKTNIEEWVPVIMLTARADEEDKILGLNLGADDYVTKPFSNRELEARIKAHLRKKALITSNANEVTSALFKIDLKKYLIKNGSFKVELTRKELELLTILIENKDKMVQKDELIDTIWGYENRSNSRTLDTHISKVRKKLEEIHVHDVIVTKRSIGYMYTEKDAK